MKTQKRNLQLKKIAVSQLNHVEALKLVGGGDDPGGDAGSHWNTNRSQCFMC